MNDDIIFYGSFLASIFIGFYISIFGPHGSEFFLGVTSGLVGLWLSISLRERTQSQFLPKVEEEKA